MEIGILVGGTPGKDCGGFCEFCYHKTVDYKKLETQHINCRFCAPNQNGCKYCKGLTDLKGGFKNPNDVLISLQKVMAREKFLGRLNFKDLKINVASWADIFFYPYLRELISGLKDFNLPIHLGYTSGKCIKDEEMVENILKWGIDEISFSVFSTNPEIRKKWMRDKTPEASLKAVEIFCENIIVNASTVVIPGITDREELFRTASILEEWGVKSFTLCRFANFESQGNILNNRPIIAGIIPHSYEEFQDLVLELHEEFNFRVVGFPASDPDYDIPFILSKNKNKEYLEKLPRISSEATIITSKLAEKYLKKIFSMIDDNHLVNIIGVDKEIADLIIADDLYSINLLEVKIKVIIPGMALMRDEQAEKILNRDGREKRVLRGPVMLSPLDITKLNDEKPIEFELKAFTNLINVINS